MTRWTRSVLALITRVRSVPLAWTLAVTATVCMLLTSVFPAFAVALSGVERGGELIPWLLDWLDEAIGLLP
jgi:hypothetical protein